eukprot:1847726-Amphidinium_carterae.1
MTAPHDVPELAFAQRLKAALWAIVYFGRHADFGAGHVVDYHPAFSSNLTGQMLHPDWTVCVWVSFHVSMIGSTLLLLQEHPESTMQLGCRIISHVHGGSRITEFLTAAVSHRLEPM